MRTLLLVLGLSLLAATSQARTQTFYYPTMSGYPISHDDQSADQYCWEQGYDRADRYGEGKTLLKRSKFRYNGRRWEADWGRHYIDVITCENRGHGGHGRHGGRGRHGRHGRW